MKIIVGIIALLVFTSCADLEKSAQLERISALETSLDSIQTTFNEFKIDSISSMSLQAYAVENRIKTYYVCDTINMALGRKMDAYKVMRKKFTPMGKGGTAITKGIEEERIKLTSLATDIKNGSGKRNKYNEYIDFEKEKVSQIRSLLNEYMENREYCLKTFDELHEELETFSLELRDKGEQ
ncbi:MAG: hypothetical protein MK066_04135 [Crocinitomicaceae bacterium]|nr:hypothetical protein [Crocinitomicaceae bacterium]